ncbi:hypothetical protein MYXA107069_22000 [Myxococcus xanthus]|nr:hypothetical protein MyxoNM_06175 [Myxococcus xanthus]SDW41565.1 hypothetical protein SAMN05444383_10273 [Myxococcus xanthus]
MPMSSFAFGMPVRAQPWRLEDTDVGRLPDAP